MKKIYLIIFLAAFMMSCGPSAKFLARDFSKPSIVALLPTINRTADVKGGIVFRNLLYLELMDEEYVRLLHNDVVDSLLNLEGITDGGQLATVENEELFEILNVDGLLFIDLMECEYTTLGISEKRRVKANFKLFVPPSKLIWEDEREKDEGKSAVGTIFSALGDLSGTLKRSAEDLGEQVLIKGVKIWVLDHELRPEMEEVIRSSLETLP